jgi:hypothetical protein
MKVVIAGFTTSTLTCSVLCTSTSLVPNSGKQMVDSGSPQIQRGFLYLGKLDPMEERLNDFRERNKAFLEKIPE